MQAASAIMGDQATFSAEAAIAAAAAAIRSAEIAAAAAEKATFAASLAAEVAALATSSAELAAEAAATAAAGAGAAAAAAEAVTTAPTVLPSTAHAAGLVLQEVPSVTAVAIPKIALSSSEPSAALFLAVVLAPFAVYYFVQLRTWLAGERLKSLRQACHEQPQNAEMHADLLVQQTNHESSLKPLKPR